MGKVIGSDFYPSGSKHHEWTGLNSVSFENIKNCKPVADGFLNLFPKLKLCRKMIRIFLYIMIFIPITFLLKTASLRYSFDDALASFTATGYRHSAVSYFLVEGSKRRRRRYCVKRDKSLSFRL